MNRRLQNIFIISRDTFSAKIRLVVGFLVLFFLLQFSSGCCGRFSVPFLLTTRSRDKAVKKTVRKWAEALKNKDKDAYLAVVDKSSSHYYQNQAEMFDNLFEVPFAKVIMKADTNDGLGWNVTELGTDFIVKVSFSYILEGGSPKPFGPIDRFIVFKNRNGVWKAQRDVTASIVEDSLPKDILGLGKLKAAVTNHFVILFSPGEEGIAQEISHQADISFSQIAASFTTTSEYKIPIKICDDYEDIVDIFGEVSEATPWALAVTFDIWSGSSQHQIIINQENYNVATSSQRKATIAHETVHIITAPLLGKRTPPFLIEGIAEYFSGYADTHYLKYASERGELPLTLDDLIELESIAGLQSEREYGLAYEESYIAVSLIEEKYGHQALLKLLAEFKKAGEEESQEILVNQVFQKVLGISWEAFKAEWQTYMRSS